MIELLIRLLLLVLIVAAGAIAARHVVLLHADVTKLVVRRQLNAANERESAAFQRLLDADKPRPRAPDPVALNAAFSAWAYPCSASSNTRVWGPDDTAPAPKPAPQTFGVHIHQKPDQVR